MKILLIQLSDIHFKENDNAVIEKEQQLFEAIRNTTLEYDEIFLLITGDSAYSGNTNEYGIALNFVIKLSKEIEKYSNKKVNTITIPGNHDCNFKNDNQARKNQINIIQKLGDSAIDDSVISQCVEVQTEYFQYQDLLHDSSKIIHSDKLFTAYRFVLGEKSVVFYCYNTAYISEIKEQAGKLYFPTSQIPEQVFGSKADLFISLFHHPFNWLYPTNKREFSTHIQNTSDFYLTGHEHESSKSQIDDLDNNVVYHIEGSVLQDSENKFESEFNLIGFDLIQESFKIEKFYWNNDKFQLSTEVTDWINYKRGKLKLKNKYNITSSFMEVIEDIGGKFTHPKKSDIKLSDLYIYPKLRFFNTKENSDDNVSYILENSESVIKNLKTDNKILLVGGENIGKTSLLKTTFKLLYEKGFTPVFIDGHLIKNSGLEEFKKLVLTHFIEQYGNDSVDDFAQEDISNVFILIDDIDKNPLKSQKAKGRFVKGLNDYYKNIVLIGNELFAIEEILSDEVTKGDLYSTFKQYEILEFNHSLRAKLISRWYSLGQDDYLTDAEIWQKCDNAVRSISIAMGQKIVPNYPIFLLILLQAVESTNPHDLNISSYGNYYQLLILKALTENIKEQSDLTMYQNYCAELAHYFFENKTIIISENEHLGFHKLITSFEKFDLPTLSAEKALATLCKVGVLEKHGETIEFKYQYTYYYFEAKYLAQNLANAGIKEIVSKLCERLYRTEFANILMFIIHFSNDEFIVNELIKNSKAIFTELAPCKLENDIEQIHNLVTELPKLFLQSKSVNEIREKENEEIDKVEQENISEPEELRKSWDLNEDISEIDVISKLNLSFKLIEILGQVLKNNHGVMTGPVKYAMLKETYLMGLRTLNVFFSVLNNNTDFILNQLKELLSRFKNVEEEKIEKVSRQLLFGLCTQISYMFVKKISDSVGSNKLMDKYSKIEEDFEFSSVKLINFLIKLDNSTGFPDRDLSLIKNSIEKHPLSYFLLKRMVVNHLHRNPVDYKDKQRICTFLGIPMESQLQIETKRKNRNEN